VYPNIRSEPVTRRIERRTSDEPPRPNVCVNRIVAAGTRTGRRWRTNVETTVRALSAGFTQATIP
jgi:hypothetical protein